MFCFAKLTWNLKFLLHYCISQVDGEAISRYCSSKYQNESQTLTESEMVCVLNFWIIYLWFMNVWFMNNDKNPIQNSACVSIVNFWYWYLGQKKLILWIVLGDEKWNAICVFYMLFFIFHWKIKGECGLFATHFNF